MSVLDTIRTPPGWSTDRLGVVSTRVSETGFPNLQSLSVFLGEGVVPRNSREDNHNQLGADLGKYQRVLPGDVVFNKLRTWQGGFGVSQYEGIVSPAYIIARPNPGVEPRFLHHLLRSDPYIAELTRLSKWMPPSQFDIAWEDLRALPLRLPPEPDQRRIANFLDQQVAIIDQIAQAKMKSIDLWDENLTVQLNLEITGNATALRHLVTSLRDGTHGSYARVDVGIPLMSVRNLQDGVFQFLEDDSCVSEIDYHEIARGCPVEVGDVLLAIVGATLGKCAINQIESPFCLQRSVAVIRCREDRIRARWLLWALRSPHVQSQLWEAAGFSAQPGVYLNTVGNLRIPTPSLGEQDRKLRLIEKFEAMTTELTALAKTQVNLLGEYKRSLITAAVIGEFDIHSASGRKVPT